MNFKQYHTLLCESTHKREYLRLGNFYREKTFIHLTVLYVCCFCEKTNPAFLGSTLIPLEWSFQWLPIKSYLWKVPWGIILQYINPGKVKHIQTTSRGQQDSSTDKDTVEPNNPSSSPWHPHVRRKELTPGGCPLPLTAHLLWHACLPPHWMSKQMGKHQPTSKPLSQPEHLG